MEDKDIPFEERKPIKVLIFSYGGRLDAAINFIDVCQLSKTPIITVNAGVSISAGLYILLAGHRRYALRRSKAMIHKGSGGVVGSFDECETSMDDYRRDIDMMKTYVLERTSIPKTLYSRKASKDWFLYADDQIKYNIVDKIVDSIDQIIA